jgi:hypothetical protein
MSRPIGSLLRPNDHYRRRPRSRRTRTAAVITRRPACPYVSECEFLLLLDGLNAEVAHVQFVARVTDRLAHRYQNASIQSNRKALYATSVKQVVEETLRT